MGVSKRIGRKFKQVTCHCLVVNESNDVVNADVVLYGEYNDVDKATRAVRRKLNNQRALVESVDVKEFFASMPIDKFMELADKVTEH